ncbi:hypothetical protein K5V21_14530 [Clostridium sardiniense]|uniref:Proteasome endopeptidase complex n=1 Tax=Clostridium sardiniense TaxID=29369 RepID=A0ABS7L1Q0_CLOSR|nr:hypothetical protein [Clostridium sardiniense]MBY0756662.1 hypothetical protein [Clostridium sardiniense]MDQ0458591.1 hypothetical protein [Clostridium sardiniense]
MSIIATVFLPEGIAMAADSRLTGITEHEDGTRDRRILSDNSQKLFLIKKNTIGISCCGDATIGGKSVGDFIRSFEIDEVTEEDNIKDVVRKLVNYTQEKHGNGVIYHVCGYYEDEQYVYNIKNNEVIRPNLNSNTIVAGASWDGETDVLVNLMASSKSMKVDWKFMQLKDGMDFAEFMVDLTIKAQRFNVGIATCGGAIDLLVITKDYAKFIKHKILHP